MIVEQHTNMRFAWQREKSSSKARMSTSGAGRLILFIYNAVWWVPLVLAFTGTIDYQAGFISFFVITFIRAVANVYRNNFIMQEQAEVFPFRSP